MHRSKEEDPAEKDSRKDVPDDMLKVKEDSTSRQTG